MINDVDETLKQLLIQKVPLDPAEVDISFDMPDREWSASVSRPTVNLYLYDIRENHQLRNNEWIMKRSGGSAVMAKPPLRIDLSYLVTVWTNDTADQHRLLGHLLATLSRYQELPADLLQGILKESQCPVLAFTAQPNGINMNAADFWGALENQLRASINYVLTVPVDIDMKFTSPLVKTTVLEFSQKGEAPADQAVLVSGVVHARGKPEEVVAEATLFLKELQKTARSDEEGKYAFRKLVYGSYTVEVSAPGRKKRELQLAVPSPSYDIEI
ncbi:MAG: hypothetical protein DRI40_03510 [Chloroflexi bacterium]|nr:MAG: hypothetical protein DRI40_03510 [Chloroflexota bacterium]